MDPKRESGGMLLAPGASSSASAAAFHSRDRRAPSSFPPVDEHLVTPEVSREEFIRGRKIVTMGANPEHAEAHTWLDFVLVPHVRQGYVAATDLLTRVSQGSNFATDVCIRQEGIDPTTGVRFLEELSFEIVNEQSKRNATEKAEDLIQRGVRRVFAIFVKTGQISEWSPTQGTFVPMDMDGMFEDRLLIRPIAVRALIDATAAEDEVAKALWKKGNPTLKRILVEQQSNDKVNEGREDGRKEGQRELLMRLLERRFGPLSADATSRIQAADLDALRIWADRIWDATSINDVLGVNE